MHMRSWAVRCGGAAAHRQRAGPADGEPAGQHAAGGKVHAGHAAAAAAATLAPAQRHIRVPPGQRQHLHARHASQP